MSMADYIYKTKAGCLRKIDQLNNRIAMYSKMRGMVGSGTFWGDVKEVNKAISNMKLNIKELQNRIEEIKKPEPPNQPQ